VSTLEDLLLFQLKTAKLPQPEREYRFHPSRKWRFDLAWVAPRVACEIEGGIWSGGRHIRGKGFENDAKKYNAAVLLGWRVLRFSPAMIRSGQALETLEQALAKKETSNAIHL